MIACMFDPVSCLESGFWSLVGTIPGWLWIVLGVAAVGVIWRVAGWPGLIALAGAIGFMFGRKSNLPGEDKSDRPEDRPASRRKQSVPKRKTIFDMLRK